MLTFILDPSTSTIIYAGERACDEAPTGRLLERFDLKSMAAAEDLAAQATKDLAPRVFVAVDWTSSVSPRYDVIEAYKVGDEVGYGFNGDRYPDGTITSISESGKVITTSSGNRYYRRKQTGTWLRTGGTWMLSRGHHSKYNREL